MLVMLLQHSKDSTMYFKKANEVRADIIAHLNYNANPIAQFLQTYCTDDDARKDFEEAVFLFENKITSKASTMMEQAHISHLQELRKPLSEITNIRNVPTLTF
tara:strand:- start:468 stop:776 length:309 start_codon:yes stop_codon:yes gene_type:complete